MSSPTPQDNNVRFFEQDRWTAGVIGLGYVGLPLLLTALERGLGAIGFDVSGDRIAKLRGGVSMVDDVSADRLRQALDSGVELTDDPQRLSDADAIFICVPSPLGRNRQPDLSHIEAAAETVSQIARSGQLIVLESTTYPGTTDEFLLPALENAGLELDRDVFLAFSPERVSPGNEMGTESIPKVVGGHSALSGDVAEAAYRRLVASVHRVSSTEAAEMTKLLENTYRAVNIGLINEMAQLAHELEIDIWEVIEAARTKPFGFQAFYPGPGVGGHCIPLDPQYLAWRAREANFTTLFIDAAEQVNSHMPGYNADRIAAMLNDHGQAVLDTEILAVGISYKPDIADDRESASLQVLTELERRGARISVLDPEVSRQRIEEHGYAYVSGEGPFSRFQLAAILTDHTDVDYQRIVDEVPLVYDARGVFRRLGIESKNITTL